MQRRDVRSRREPGLPAKGRFPEGLRSRRGAAMMEFLLTFPVYAVLMGGLFLFGEMLTAKIRLQRAERFLVWSAEAGHTEQVGRVRDLAAQMVGAGKERATGRQVTADSEKMDVRLDRGEPDAAGFFRSNRALTEMAGGMRGMELVRLPAVAAAFLAIQENHFPEAEHPGRRLSRGGFGFDRITDAEGYAVSTVLLRSANGAVRQAVYSGEVADWRAQNGKLLYLNTQPSLAILSIAMDVWPYLDTDEGRPQPLVQDPETTEHDQGSRAYERMPALAPYSE